MRPNPLDDAVTFLTQPGWFTPVFWLLLLAAIAIAVLAWRHDPAQRTPRNLGICGLRILAGTMWWQQTLWKIPPNFGGLQYWMQQEADHAAIALQGALVRGVVLQSLGVRSAGLPRGARHRRNVAAWPVLPRRRHAWPADRDSICGSASIRRVANGHGPTCSW